MRPADEVARELAPKIHYATEHVQGCSPACVVELGIIASLLEPAIREARAEAFEQAISVVLANAPFMEDEGHHYAHDCAAKLHHLAKEAWESK
jgi:hypothetical protein